VYITLLCIRTLYTYIVQHNVHFYPVLPRARQKPPGPTTVDGRMENVERRFWAGRPVGQLIWLLFISFTSKYCDEAHQQQKILPVYAPNPPIHDQNKLELEARLFLMQLLADNDPKIGESAGQPPRPPEGDLRRENCRKDGGRPQCHEGQVGSRLGRLSRVAGKFWAGGFKERMERGL